MKRIFLQNLFIALALVACIGAYAQAPQKLSYQAVIRNTENKPVADKQVGMRISLLQGGATGTAVYTETITPTTNTFGLVSIEIGAANPTDFAAIDWSAGSYFIKTETDPNGGINYTITATSQLLSVPYALYAEKVGTVELSPEQITTLKGDTGAEGASAYEVALANGFTGTEAEWLTSLEGADGADGATGAAGSDGANGASAYEVALANGFTGTETEWLTSLEGADGADGATGAAGSDGADGASAYAVAVANGFTGTEAEWLTSLEGADGADGATGAQGIQGLKGDKGDKGDAGAAGSDGGDGASAYEVAVANGFTGTEAEWLTSLEGADGADGATGAAGADGADGASAYALAVANGFTGTEAEWLTSLEGADGATGAAGSDGADGASAYEIALSNGFTGTEAEWLTSLEGADGATGAAGADGSDGKTILNGTTDPGAGTGVDGDFYLNTTSSTLFGPKSGGAWGAGTSLIGATGATGPAGADGAAGGFTNRLGDTKDGGIIFYLYIGTDGNEHGLIVHPNESIGTWGSSGLVGADRSEDGAYNTPLMNGTAKTYVDGLGAGWYIPSIDELSLLWHARFHVNKAIRAGSGTLLSTTANYWSSTEYYSSTAFGFVNGNSNYGGKSGSLSVRAVRAF